jgi:hypothetical protein
MTLRAHNFVCRPSIKVNYKAKLYPLLKAFQRYVACHLSMRNRGNFWLLVVGNQIATLTPNPSFGHNLCFKYPNGSCELILDIQVLVAFQWYKEPLNPMNFDPCNCPLKIWKSIETPIPKVRAHLGVWGFIPSHFPASREHEMWLPNFIIGLHLYKPLPWSQAQS